MEQTIRRIIFWVLILLGVVLLYKAFSGGQKAPESLDVSTLKAKIQRNEIVRLTIKQTEVLAVDVRGDQLRTELSNEQQQYSLFYAATRLDTNGNPYVAKVEDVSSDNGVLWGVLLKWMPFVVSIALGVFLGGVLLRKVFPPGR
ncbi:MAG: hypothetical protein QOG00_1703 [Pyrinomonadaceae bacterium]|nr:hypothetical protein [Pyrinomonadaceae bacterium]